MTTRRNDKSNGKILLWNNFKESASGHTESNEGAEIVATGDNNIVLDIYNSYNNVYRSAQDEDNHEYYRIDVNKLVELIKANGIKLD